MSDYYYTQNDYILNSPLNKSFSDIHFMSENEFEDWLKSFARLVKSVWDEHGIPFEKGRSETKITSDFRKLHGLDVSDLLIQDSGTFEKDCIYNPDRTVNAANSFFPNILKAKDNMGNNKVSVYDLFRDDDYHYNELYKTSVKAVRQDSIGNYSDLNKSMGSKVLSKQEATEYLQNLNKQGRDYWFDSRKKEYDAIKISTETLEALILDNIIDEKYKLDLDTGVSINAEYFYIRTIHDIKVFPKIVSIAKTGKRSAPGNFSPVIAKYIYSHFTEAFKDQKQIFVYDPSMGFGGRLLGALSLDDRVLHYVGSDPNTENWIDEIDLSRYDILERAFDKRSPRTFQFTSEYICCGSEDVDSLETFQKYEGHLDLVFTSPPYFSAEIYSDDETQSSNRYLTYDDWRDKYWAKTIETCVQYLKHDRYMVINIANTTYKGKPLHLVEDTIDIAKSYGMIEKDMLKMVIATTPGANRIDEEHDSLTFEYSCEVNGTKVRYEPVLVFYKP